MLQLYFTNYSNKINVSIHSPLEAVKEQALEIFDRLPQNDGSFMGIINENSQTVQISKYNKFVWLIEIPNAKRKGNYQIFLTPNKTRKLIEDLFNGFNPMKINGLFFEKNKN